MKLAKLDLVADQIVDKKINGLTFIDFVEHPDWIKYHICKLGYYKAIKDKRIKKYKILPQDNGKLRFEKYYHREKKELFFNIIKKYFKDNE